MRRILVLGTVVALVAAMVAISALPAAAASQKKEEQVKQEISARLVAMGGETIDVYVQQIQVEKVDKTLYNYDAVTTEVDPFGNAYIYRTVGTYDTRTKIFFIASKTTL